MNIETILINKTGMYRKATLHGKSYYVVPMALISPGVLPGSKGKLFYPAEEISKNYDSWNGMPLVVTHPIVNGRPVSARSATILDSHGIGVVLNARINQNGKLVAEGWFDVEKTNQVDARIISKIERGEQIELSTGLFTDNIPVKNVKEAIHNGKQYTHIARNYRPDHLAILPDELGACSIKDGCGVGVLNSAKKKKKKCAACEAMGSGCNCSPTSNDSSMRKNAGKLTPKSEKCKGCGKSKGKCECEPVDNLSPEKEPTGNELSYSELHVPLEKNLNAKFPGAYLQEVYRDYVIFRYAGNIYQTGYNVDKKTDVVSLDSEMPTVVRRVVTYKPVELSPGVVITNTEAAKIILNVGKKKGWTDEARAKAAATRKRKKKVAGNSSIFDLESKTGKPIPMKDTVSAFQKIKQGQLVSFTKHGPPGDHNGIDGTVVARYKFSEGLPWKGVGAFDVKTSSGEIKKVSAVTQFHRIASADNDRYTQNIFSDEARAAALLARKKSGEAVGAIKDAGKKAVVSGVKAAGGAAKAGLKRTGQAYKEVALHLLGKLKAKLGMGGKSGTSKTKPKGSVKAKPSKSAKPKEKMTSKQRSQARQAKLAAKVKAFKDSKMKKAADKQKKTAAKAKVRDLKRTVGKNKSAIAAKASKAKAQSVLAKKKASQPSKPKGKSTPKPVEAKSKSKVASRPAKGKDGYNKKTSSKEPNARVVAEKKASKLSEQEKKSARYEKDGAKTKAGKRLTQADVDAQRAKTKAAGDSLAERQKSLAESKEKLALANKINKVNAATDKKWKAWGIE